MSPKMFSGVEMIMAKIVLTYLASLVKLHVLTICNSHETEVDDSGSASCLMSSLDTASSQ